MRKNFKARILILVLLTVSISFIDSRVYAVEPISVKKEQKREIFVARDVANVRPIWCGDKNALVYLNDTGIYWHDITTNQKIKVADYTNVPLNCTPEGNWIIYMDKANTRWDKGSKGNVIVDIWRYKLGSNIRQKLAIVNDVGSYDILSPIGLKVLIGKQPNSTIIMPEPKWEPVFSLNEWLPGGAVWFSDASGVIRVMRKKLAIEIFSPTGKSMIMDPKLGEIVNLRNLQIDSGNRLFMLVEKKLDNREKEHVVKCQIDIKQENISCDKLIEGNHSITDFNIARDGKSIVYMENQDQCARLLTDSKETICITTSPIHNLSISPDGRWLAFTRFRKMGKSVNFDVVANDLYVVKIIKN